jgi:acetyl-CoA carboxylase biotin carboxyl carrier protein
MTIMTDGVREQAPLAGDDFGVSAVRELIEFLSQTDVTEIQIERGGARLHIKRGTIGVAPAAPTTAAVAAVSTISTPAGSPQAAVVLEHDHLLPGQSAVTAPMVGTYYSAPSPKEKPYVEDGDIIQIGDRVGIIEAMKMMNEIESEVSGRVVRVLVKNAQPVEYGQVLLIVEPI